VILGLLTAATAGQDVEWQTRRLACLDGDPAACMAIDYVEEACGLGDLDGCAAWWVESGPPAWDAAALSERCATEPRACELLEDFGWTLPFRRLAPDDEPVFVGPMEALPSGFLLIQPEAELEVWNPETGAQLGTLNPALYKTLPRTRSQDRYEVSSGPWTASLERNSLQVSRDGELVADIVAGVPLSPMLIDHGRLIVGGRLVFDLEPEAVSEEAVRAWLEERPPPPKTEVLPAAIELIGGDEGTAHLYRDLELIATEPIALGEVLRFDALEPGWYTVQFTSPQGGAVFDVTLRGEDRSQLLKGDPRLVLAGRVTRRWGRPVAGALVYVEHDPVLPVTTDAEGRFYLPLDLLDDEHARVYAEHPDGIAPTVHVEPGEEPSLRIVSREHPSALQIRTVGQGGDPVPGRVEVSVSGQHRRADASGTTWVIRPPGEAVEVTARWGVKRAEAPIPSDEEMLIVYFTNARLQVAAPAMTLLLETPEGDFRRLAQGASIRTSELSLLPAGSYTLWHHSSRGLERHDFDLAGSQELELVPPFESTGASVRGRLVTNDGEALIGVRISGHRIGSDFGPVSVLSGLDGSFVIEGLHPGDHTFELVQKTAGGWAHYDDLEVFVEDEGNQLGSVVR